MFNAFLKDKGNYLEKKTLSLKIFPIQMKQDNKGHILKPQAEGQLLLQDATLRVSRKF